MVLVAGLAGGTAQARREAEIARELGYHAGMLSLGAMRGAAEDELVTHCLAVSRVMPLVGFYLQPAVGGIELGAGFWRRFAEIENVAAIKIAPFNRYRTLDVVKGVVAARAEDRSSLYRERRSHRRRSRDAVRRAARRRSGDGADPGGLLGHWSVWTTSAVRLLETLHAAVARGALDQALLDLDAKVTDANSAFFDVANGFRGCIAGCHEVLRRQGLFAGRWCLDPAEDLSPGQAEEITRVMAVYPAFDDTPFVRANLERWLA